IGNQAQDFAVGANLAVTMMGIASGQHDQVRDFVRGTQTLFENIRLCPKPIVAAPYGRVLGGGVEIALAAARRVAAAETYMGLVELGVGLIPGWGGCKEMIRRHVSPHMKTPGADALPYFQQVFETIAMAKVGESVEQSRRLGYLDEDDKVVMNKERLIGEAKQAVLQLVAEGYTPPPAGGDPVYALGRRGLGAIAASVHAMRVGGYISAYDQKLARALGWALCGGDLNTPQWVTEQYILDLEFEQLLKLAVEPKTQERIMGMLQTGKPLRN
ncbi:MAG TPA: enoyl-CoA hydratase/isomerase family protein, partial [Roseiflexaceae bacterium]